MAQCIFPRIETIWKKRKQLNGEGGLSVMTLTSVITSSSSSSLVTLLHPHWPLAIPQKHSAGFYFRLRDFELPVTSAWNVLPLRYAQGLLLLHLPQIFI